MVRFFTCIILFFSLIFFSCKQDKKTKAVENPIFTDSIYQFVDELPRFPGCEQIVNKENQKLCSDSLLLKYVYSNIKYPQYAIDNHIQGRCVVAFVVEKDGAISNAKITKDIGGGCGEAALAVVHSMNQMSSKWIPGKNKGEIQRVVFNLPVSFRLEEKKEQ